MVGFDPLCAGIDPTIPAVAGSAFDEIKSELRGLMSGRAGVADGIISPIVFVGMNSVAGVQVAGATGIGVALAIVVWRLARGRALQYAVGGLFGTGLAIFLALRSGDARDYFLPGILTGIGTTVVALASIAVRRPLVAWTSWITRGWPLEWYWHPRVRPAYTRVTWLWAWFFGVRTTVQGWLFATEQTAALGVVRVITGWPGLLALLIATYVVGRTRLEALEGPSVDEFSTSAPPPWKGQTKGF